MTWAMLTSIQAMETDEKKDEEGKPKTRKVKKQVRKGDLPIVAGTTALDTNTKNQLIEQELNMVAEDKLVADTEEKKNELETYIYDMRNKLDEQYSDFASEEEKDKIRAKLTDSEVSHFFDCLTMPNLHTDPFQDWLYEDGDDASKAAYIAKMEEIRTLIGPIAQRYFDKVEAERQALQAKLDAEAAAKKAAEEEAKKAAEPEKGKSDKDEEMTDAEAKPEVEEAQ
jgi:heat shock 70kDa protein 4